MISGYVNECWNNTYHTRSFIQRIMPPSRVDLSGLFGQHRHHPFNRGTTDSGVSITVNGNVSINGGANAPAISLPVPTPVPIDENNPATLGAYRRQTNPMFRRGTQECGRGMGAAPHAVPFHAAPRPGAANDERVIDVQEDWTIPDLQGAIRRNPHYRRGCRIQFDNIECTLHYRSQGQPRQQRRGRIQFLNQRCAELERIGVEPLIDGTYGNRVSVAASHRLRLLSGRVVLI